VRHDKDDCRTDFRVADWHRLPMLDVPVPSPPKLLGALLVVAMTVGYMATDKLLAARFKDRKTASVGYHPENPDKP
jgi:hypothetical protein